MWKGKIKEMESHSESQYGGGGRLMCKKCPWLGALESIADMRAMGGVSWAEDFLIVTQRSIETNKHITPKQQKALLDIEIKAGLRREVPDVPKSDAGNSRKREGLFS